MADLTALTKQADVAKCEGVDCAFKNSCGRYLRPEAENQAWAAFYALADDDCNSYEVISD